MILFYKVKVITVSSLILFIGLNHTLAIANDIDTPFKDSASNSQVIPGKMKVIRGSIKPSAPVSSLQRDVTIPSPIGCDISTTQVINLNPKNYRWYDEDVKASFVDPAFKSHFLLSAKLCVKYKDVDLTSTDAYTPELNVVQFGKTNVGVLPGNDGEQLTTCWNVSKQVSSSLASHIPFYVNVDSAHNRHNWAVYLHEAKLSTCHFKEYFVPPFLPNL